MTLSEIPYVRPEMARPAPYRWQDNVPKDRCRGST